MLRIFKNARRKLSGKGNFFDQKEKLGTYLRYSLGEILLLVIGILIALNINNWNEAQKSRKTEIKSYVEIQDDLKKTFIDVNNDLEKHSDILKATVRLRKMLLLKEGFNDSISFYLNEAARDFQLFPKTGAFESLRSRGLEILTNDSLRLKVTDLYQLGIDNLSAQGREESQTRNITSIMEPYLDKHLTVSTEMNEKRAIPGASDFLLTYKYQVIDLEKLKNDRRFLRTLESVIQIRIFKMEKHLSLAKSIEKVIEDIEKELVRLKK